MQVLANHRSGRLALAGQVNIPASVDAAFADGAVTSSGGHSQVLYESLALFHNMGSTTAERQQAARSHTQQGDVYYLLDSLPQLPNLVQRLRKDTVPLLKIMVLDAEHFDLLSNGSSSVGNRGLDMPVLKPLVDSAHAMGRRVWAHVETARDCELSIDAGIDGRAHVAGYGVANVRKLHAAGVTLLTGSDTYSSVAAIENDINALSSALRATPLQRLRIRSVTTPQAIFPGRKIGVLDPGYEASALALDCNPLVNVDCEHKISKRLKQGIWLRSGKSSEAYPATCEETPATTFALSRCHPAGLQHACATNGRHWLGRVRTPSRHYGDVRGNHRTLFPTFYTR